MKTPFEHIVNREAVGGMKPDRTNAPSPRLPDLLRLADEEKLPAGDHENLLILIDFQHSFLEYGELPVSGSHDDVRRTLDFGYRNLPKISRIAYSLDTHIPRQIFFPCWWADANGRHPDPFTVIADADVQAGKWMPLYHRQQSETYAAKLQESGKILTIWPYHCLQGTKGASLDEQVSNFIYFHSVAKKNDPYAIVKGLDPLSEMYGIIRPEYAEQQLVNHGILEEIAKYRKIIIAGEAASHCVLESVTQVAEHYRNRKDITKRIHLLEDCMSPIAGYEQTAKDKFAGLSRDYGIQLVRSTDLTL